MGRVSTILCSHLPAALLLLAACGCSSWPEPKESTSIPEHSTTPLSKEPAEESESIIASDFDYTTGTRFLKMTRGECEIRGGEYISHPNSRPEDMIDCSLPAQIRFLGSNTTYLRLRPRKILGSVYDYLYRVGVEKSGYGLYSYVLIPLPSARSEHLLEELFKTTSYVELNQITFAHINIIYLPVKERTIKSLQPIISDGSAPPVHQFSRDHYDYEMAKKILSLICSKPTKEIKEVCSSDLSQGPYLFTYPQPASELMEIPPPHLFVDLSDTHKKAFGETLSAYREQVKRSDYTDMEKISAFHLRVLDAILTAADWIRPIKAVLADTVHMSPHESADR